MNIVSTDFEIRITKDSVHVTERRVRRITDSETGETIDIPLGDHGEAIALGNFAVLDEKTGEVLSVDTDAFNAAVQAKIVAVCGKDLANVIADKALATALVADANAQAAKIIDDAKKSAVSVAPVAGPIAP